MDLANRAVAGRRARYPWAVAVSAIVLAASSHPDARGWAQLLSSSPILMSETRLRDLATFSPDPLYPNTAEREGVEGVAVAVLLMDRSDGSVRVARVLEAPDEAIEVAVRKAVLQWTFAFDLKTRNSGYDVEGRLTFYFEIEGGHGQVLSPAQKAQMRARDRLEVK